jgi:hypothetical protein
VRKSNIADHALTVSLEGVPTTIVPRFAVLNASWAGSHWVDLADGRRMEIEVAGKNL